MILQKLLGNIVGLGTQTSGVMPSSENPQGSYANVLEREFLKKGKFCVQRYLEIQKERESLQVEEDALKVQLSGMETETQKMIDLPTGDQVTIDFSRRPQVVGFWKEVEEKVGVKAGFSQQSLYDPAFLAQESDDLLAYL